MYRLGKNEMLFGEGKCALQMLCESEAPVYELNQKLIMRKINKLKKEIAMLRPLLNTHGDSIDWLCVTAVLMRRSAIDTTDYVRSWISIVLKRSVKN